MTRFAAPKGTIDLVPPASATFLAVREDLAHAPQLAGYGYVETPIFEDTALFERGVGESTDVVAKEMYTLTDRGGRSLTLRPEGTAGVLRAALQYGLHLGQLPVKLWYSGSYFRYERPQAGRYRHFSQVGAEALGVDDPALDAELLWLADEGFKRVGLARYRILLNSLGDQQCRPAYRERLREFLRSLDLDPDTRRRAEINPLRVLDDKRPSVQAQLTDAPLLTDLLCEPCRTHYNAVRELLRELGVEWEEAPRLVRGLDYYTRTTFEFVHDWLGSQSAVGGGGRYDGLSEQIGGPSLPGIGWAIGVDRTVNAMEAEGLAPPVRPRVAVFLVPLGDQAKSEAVRLAARLRAAGVATDLAYGTRGLKGAMRAADRVGATYAVILGERELAEGVVALKTLATADQRDVPLDSLTATLIEELE